MLLECFILLLIVLVFHVSAGPLCLALPALFLANLPGLSAEDGSPIFKSTRTICECGAKVKESGRKAGITLYTRHGVVLNALHFEKRCRTCSRGYFYSFHTEGRHLYYEDTCLDQPYLITSRKTGFAIDLLYEWTLNILHHNSRYWCIY